MLVPFVLDPDSAADHSALLLRERRVDVEHKRVNVRTQLGHNE